MNKIDEIEKAYKVHSSVPLPLRTSPIILRKPEMQILHSLNQTPSFGKLPEEGIGKDMVFLHRYVISGKRLASEIPPPDDIEDKFRERWFEGGDHELLKEILDSGRVPLAWNETWSPARPRTLIEALHTARKRGYTVPDRYLKNASKTSYSEAEAFYAAYMLVSGNFMGWRDGSHLGDMWDVRYAWDRQRSSICQLTGQFFVPDPLVPDKTPYFLDQLWIFATPDNHVRLIGLEIDGEIHLEDQVIGLLTKR